LFTSNLLKDLKFQANVNSCKAKGSCSGYLLEILFRSKDKVRFILFIYSADLQQKALVKQNIY